ncbi:hypothetical protein PQ469_30045 [Mucilaginibacter sp. KACC 22773]|jgi:hypothetical protein|uniref:hypothetical protein n=1 Tax=Mucilaginibacter sp. KACC 22773 TaxID=3025671 RepID=UPI0023673CCC|nr:hypothetical protein [Mucilaginibacter sp. KACC 22773]WDF78130.1 hypothetical protein PQ469_30045 [Mucilaginibacter sp. KACC 22773]
MKKKLLLALVVTGMFLLQACVTAKIASNKQADYTKKPKKIFILLNGAKASKYFFVEFTRSLQLKLTEKKIESTMYIRDELSLDSEGDINKKITEFNPEALLVMKQTVSHTTNNYVDGGTFEISLIDGETKKTVWKSVFEIYSQFGLSEAVDTGVKKLYDKMVEDQIF